jgi:predicted NUDIX family phosphoesterase
MVLVVPAARLHEAGPLEGFSPEVERYLPALLDPAAMQFLPRAEAEDDPTYKQLIPYIVLRHGGRLFHYTRAGGGEARLRARRSVGIGGHISDADAAGGTDPYRTGMLREVAEEVAIRCGSVDQPLGFINDDETAVGRVHLGVVHLFELETPDVTPREDALAGAGFAPAGELWDEREEFETWSRFVLEEIIHR